MTSILHDTRAWFFLLVGAGMLLMICALAGLGTVMRPVRWSERRGQRSVA